MKRGDLTSQITDRCRVVDVELGPQPVSTIESPGSRARDSMRRGLPIVCIFALVQAQAKPAVSIRLDERCLTCVSKQLRGGAASYERNPSYQQAPTLGDVDRDGNYVATATFRSPLQRQRPPPLTRAIVDFFRDLNEYCPTLYRGTLLSALLYALWQFPPSSIFSKTLRNHFVTSSYNVRRKRYHALVLSAFSHAEFRHLALNMYAFFTFGRSVKQTLASQGVELWPFVVTAAVFGNLAFLLFDKGRGGSCIGLSGVTRELF